MTTELSALVVGVLADLDGAGALADWLQEHDREREAGLLRRRWRAWKTQRKAWDDGDEETQYHRPMVDAFEKGADTAFRKYIRSRFAPRKKPAPSAAHECRRPRTCTCSVSGLEPSDDCPIHSGGDWPPRCETCGRMMRRQPTEAA